MENFLFNTETDTQLATLLKQCFSASAQDIPISSSQSI